MSQFLAGVGGVPQGPAGFSQFSRMTAQPGVSQMAQTGTTRTEPRGQPSVTRIQRIGPNTTRLQFIVPGEQFDLYGYISFPFLPFLIDLDKI